MVTKKAYRLLYQYARKFAKVSQDVDDIVQEALELFIKNPVKGILPKKFFYTLVKRGSYRFYFNTNTKQLKNQDVLPADFEEISLQIPDEYDMENIILMQEFKTKLKNIKFKNGKLANEECKLLQRILKGEHPKYSDRGNYALLKKKLACYF